MIWPIWYTVMILSSRRQCEEAEGQSFYFLSCYFWNSASACCEHVELDCFEHSTPHRLICHNSLTEWSWSVISSLHRKSGTFSKQWILLISLFEFQFTLFHSCHSLRAVLQKCAIGNVLLFCNSRQQRNI